MRTIQQMVDQEIQCCVSSLVSTLASCADVGYQVQGGKELGHLCEQALELAAPVDDYEEAATQAGWWRVTDNDREETRSAQCADFRNGSSFHSGGGWKQLCQTYDIDPYQREVFEHWAVSQRLAEKLIAQGERVDTDFACLNVWARTTTGQAISADDVIKRIYRAAHEPDAVTEGPSGWDVLRSQSANLSK